MPLDGLDPCTLLTADQGAELGLDQPPVLDVSPSTLDNGGDSASHGTWALYTEQVRGATDGAFHGMIAYERQLVAIRERLTEIEGRYAATESDAAARFGRTL